MNKNDPPRKALGKGLHALLPKRTAPPAAVAPAHDTFAPAPPIPARIPEGGVHTIPLDHIIANPDQPRRDFDPAALAELTASIEREGIIQPLLVRKVGPSEYQIIAGERRWRAAKAAQLTEVPAIVRTADDQKVLELALVENIQREDLNPIELAVAFQRMAAELGLSHDQVGQRTGKERTTITNAVRLLQLPADLQALVSNRQLSPGHARALLKFTDPETQREIAKRCVAEGWSVRQIESYTRNTKQEKALPVKTETPKVDPNIRAAIDEMERVLGTRVKVVEKAGGKGHLEIEYYSSDDLSRIYDLIVTS